MIINDLDAQSTTLPRLGSRVSKKLKQFQDISAPGASPREPLDTERNAKTPPENEQIREKSGKSVHGVFDLASLPQGRGTGGEREAPWRWLDLVGGAGLEPATRPLWLAVKSGPCNHQRSERFAIVGLAVVRTTRTISQIKDSPMSRRFIVAMLGLSLVSDAAVFAG
jgi:hypothetical protein